MFSVQRICPLVGSEMNGMETVITWSAPNEFGRDFLALSCDCTVSVAV